MEPSIAGGEGKNPLIEFGRMDDWAQLSLDIRLMRSYLRAGLAPREALAAFRGELCAVALRTHAA